MTPLEAAARAWFHRDQTGRMDAGRLRNDGKPWQWEDLTTDGQRAYLAIVEPIVEAALVAYENAPPCDAVSRNGINCTERAGHPGAHVSHWKERWTA